MSDATNLSELEQRLADIVRMVVRQEIRLVNPEGAVPETIQRINRRPTRYSDLCARAGRCQSCGWVPPPVDRWSGVLNVHHVVPSAAGGTEDGDNLLVLCPNCHALAHRLTFIGRRGARYVGPGTAERLLGMLAHLRDSPDTFRDAEAAFLENLRTARGDDL